MVFKSRNLGFFFKLLLYLLFAFSNVNAQNKFDVVIDSILSSDSNTRDKIKFLGTLAGQERYTPPTRKLITTAFNISRQNDDKWLLANSYYSLGNFYFFNGQLDSSLVALDLAESNLTPKDKLIKASILSTRGGVYSRSGNVLLAINAQLEGKTILENIDTLKLDSLDNVRKTGRLMASSNSLANLYLKTEDYDLALKTYEETFLLAKGLHNLPNTAIILSNKGELLNKMGRFKEALEVSKRAKQMKIDAKLPLRFIALSNYNIGQTYKAIDSVQLALQYFNISLEQSEESHYNRGKMLALSDRGLIFLEQNKITQAKEDCLVAYQIANTIDESDSKIKTCNCLYKVERALGNSKESLAYFEKYTTLKDSIFNEKNIRRLTQMSMQYDFDKKEAEQQEIIKAKDRKRNLLLIGVSVLLVFSLLLLAFYRKRLKYRKTIAKQNEILKNQEIKELEQQNRLTAINSMINGQEKERSRIAKDLHDGLGSLLTSVKSHFLATQDDKISNEKTVTKTASLIDQACSEVRRISHNMMPHALTISGIQDSIKDIAARLEIDNYNVTLEINSLPKLTDTQEVMIYRLIQEIVSNIKKHAEAKNIFIQLFSHNKAVHLIVEDDGKGFDITKVRIKKGLGLKNIESRVAYLNGTIDWDSKKGSGTTVNINFNI